MEFIWDEAQGVEISEIQWTTFGRWRLSNELMTIHYPRSEIMPQVYGQPGNLMMRDEHGNFVPVPTDIQDRIRVTLTDGPTAITEDMEVVEEDEFHEETLEERTARLNEAFGNTEHAQVRDLQEEVANAILGREVVPMGNTEIENARMLEATRERARQNMAMANEALIATENAQPLNTGGFTVRAMVGDMAPQPISDWSFSGGQRAFIPAPTGQVIGVGGLHYQPPLEYHTVSVFPPEYRKALLDDIRAIVRDEIASKLKEGCCASCLVNSRLPNAMLCAVCVEKMT